MATKINTRAFRAICALLVFNVLVIGAAGAGLFSGLRINQNLGAMLITYQEKAAPLSLKVREMHIAVVQVQQFLSDISATRGQDGLNDGLEQAAQNADDFTKTNDEAQVLAQDLGATEVIQILNDVKAAFTPYYDVGKKMATAYINEGPSGGNKIMPDFDNAAESLSNNLEKSLSLVDELVNSNAKKTKRIEKSSQKITITSLSALVFFSIFSILITISIGRSIFHASSLLSRANIQALQASRGDFNSRITLIERDDEIGTLLKSFNGILDMAEAFSKEAGAAMLCAGRKEYYRRIPEAGFRGEIISNVRRLNEVLKGMETRETETLRFSRENVLAVADNVNELATALRHNAEALIRSARNSLSQAVTVASAAEQATVSVQSVSVSANQLDTSISQINHQTEESAHLAKDARDKAAQTKDVVSGLNETAQKIGIVIELIQGIASQTNLLALNATIEAARAGDAGKGFAVVANEVKTLATQTARATEDIGKQVSQMQTLVTGAVGAITGISDMISLIADNIGMVASSVSTQGAATSEISRNVQDAAAGAQDVARTIESVSTAAQEIERMASDVFSSSENLAARSNSLRSDVAAFIKAISGEEAEEIKK